MNSRKIFNNPDAGGTFFMIVALPIWLPLYLVFTLAGCLFNLIKKALERE